MLVSIDNRRALARRDTEVHLVITKCPEVRNGDENSGVLSNQCLSRRFARTPPRMRSYKAFPHMRFTEARTESCIRSFQKAMTFGFLAKFTKERSHRPKPRRVNGGKFSPISASIERRSRRGENWQHDFRQIHKERLEM